MLKIKDNVDLKELEKFGFKPKYDEDTGEIVEYYKLVYGVMEYDKDKFVFKIQPYKKRIITHYGFMSNATWNTIANNEALKTLYYLIKADLVEVVE